VWLAAHALSPSQHLLYSTALRASATAALR
jgi:hypothetical protein